MKEKISFVLDVYIKIDCESYVELCGVSEHITFRTVNGITWITFHLGEGES